MCVCVYVCIFQMLLILLMIVQGNGAVDQLNFADRLYNWMRHGFPEFGDHGKWYSSVYMLCVCVCVCVYAVCVYIYAVCVCG